ncbi:MAG: type II toxin-antitoxin system Phd/YefM family antitoxin [Oscillospiraceae bacterium]|nr:type II toxin-antitoxin system Phd/YefM family antitoxin [Oscillospiraceae bacterium]
MDSIVKTMNHLVSVSAFNKGEAGTIFSTVKKTNEPKLVLRRNEPECILISPLQYTQLIEELEDLRDYKLAVERLVASQGQETISFEEILREDGLSLADLDAMEDIDFE